MYLLDLSGDGKLDVVVQSTSVDLGGARDVGAVHVFRGGALAGAVLPLATLSVPGAVSSDWLGSYGISFADVTGDGTLDVVAPTPDADVGGVQDAGAIYVFAGDAGWAGAKPPTATLTVPGALQDDELALVALADVDGDGALDVLGRAASDSGGAFDCGAVHVFRGVSGFAGTTAPSASMALAQPQNGVRTRFVQLADLTGEGVLDVLAYTYDELGGVDAPGAFHVFAGGPMAGPVAPLARLAAAAPASGDRMLFATVADFTGDGRLDVLGRAPSADVNGVRNSGALYLFTGVAGGVGAAATVLTVPGAARNDQLGY